jgi:hypothetical protein
MRQVRALCDRRVIQKVGDWDQVRCGGWCREPRLQPLDIVIVADAAGTVPMLQVVDGMVLVEMAVNDIGAVMSIRFVQDVHV